MSDQKSPKVDKNSVDELQDSIIEKLDDIDLLQVKQWFEIVNKPDVVEATVKAVITVIRGVIGYKRMPIPCHRLYRCRPLEDGDSVPKQLSGLLSPPAEIATQQRCNLAGKPVLYVSDNPNSLPLECHISVGQRFVILQFNHIVQLEEDISCTLLGLDERVLLGNHPSIESLETVKIDFYGKHFSKVREIERQFHTSFVRDDDPSGATYMFTACLCDEYFSKSLELEAIIYPSVAAKGRAHNYAIRVGVIDRSYKPVKAVLCVLNSDQSILQIDAAAIGEGETLEWGKDTQLDGPVSVGIRKIDPNDPDIYIAPWK